MASSRRESLEEMPFVVILASSFDQKRNFQMFEDFQKQEDPDHFQYIKDVPPSFRVSIFFGSSKFATILSPSNNLNQHDLRRRKNPFLIQKAI